jgi:hypothetical protein
MNTSLFHSDLLFIIGMVMALLFLCGAIACIFIAWQKVNVSDVAPGMCHGIICHGHADCPDSECPAHPVVWHTLEKKL